MGETPMQGAKLERLEPVYRRLLEELERSGETMASFGPRHGVSAKTLSRWRHRLGFTDRFRATRGLAEAMRGDEGALIPVRVVGDESGGEGVVEEKAVVVEQSPGFEVVLNGSRRIRVVAGFDEGELQRLIQVVERC